MPGLTHKFFMAPMAEITTPALRKTIREFSSSVVLSSEMLSAGALVAGGMHNRPLSDKHEFDDPIIFQIAGNDPQVMKDACDSLSKQDPYSIDINMGCSAPEILKRGFCAMLLRDREKARGIVKACRSAAKTRLSVKMRCGFETYDRAYLAGFIKMLQDEGIDFITMHPRTAKMGFRRKADWRVIREMRESVSIPIIGNGDIATHHQVVQRMNEYGCEGVMIGREAVRSPWIFALCENLLHGSDKVLEINVHRVFIKTLEWMKTYLPEHLQKSRSHRFCHYYSRNAVFSHELFTKIRQEASIDSIMAIINDYFHRNPGEAAVRLQSHQPENKGGNNGIHQDLERS